MNNKLVLIVFFLIFLVVPITVTAFFNSGDITLSLNQKEYYFKTGENAVIDLDADNTYDNAIGGLLSYTITQSVNQGNFQYSSSNTQSTSLSVDKGESTIPLSFGTSDTPLMLSIDMKFSYTKDKAREVVLSNIKIHFVSDDSQKNNQQNQIKSSSQETRTSQQQNDPFGEQEQRVQQMMNQIMGNNKQQTQNSKQALENNQIAQDSSALKQQMQKQIQEQQQMKEEFQRQLAQNPDFQQEHKNLLDQGYNMVNSNVNPTSNNTGDFELNYQKTNGEQASLKGKMQNGKMQNIQKYTAEIRQQMFEQLQQNQDFQKYQKQLQNQGFEQQNIDFQQEPDKTTIKVNYINHNNTATISADIVNKTVKNVKLLNNKDKGKNNYWWIFLIILLCSILGYFVYKKFRRKSQKDQVVDKKIPEKVFDYRSEALSMLERSRKLFHRKEYKNAYGLSGQALRLYLRYKNNLKKEKTNDEIIRYLRKHKKRFEEAKECLDLCSLVEFAKYQANKKDFNKIINYAKKLIE